MPLRRCETEGFLDRARFANRVRRFLRLPVGPHQCELDIKNLPDSRSDLRPSPTSCYRSLNKDVVKESTTLASAPSRSDTPPFTVPPFLAARSVLLQGALQIERSVIRRRGLCHEHDASCST
jgi:hypothetical protein